MRYGCVPAVICLLLYSGVLPASAVSIGELHGDVRVKKEFFSPYRPVYDTYPVVAGDIFSVGAESTLVLRLLDTTRATLGPGSVARFDGEKFASCHLTLFEGQMRSLVETLGEQEYYAASSPAATIGVRGTDFAMTVAPTGALLVAVATGQVEAVTADTRELVRAGEALQADPFAGLRPLSADAARDLDAWRDVQQLCLATDAETVTERFRPFVYRELGRIRVTFDEIMALYTLHAELNAAVPDTEPARSDHYDSMAAHLRQAAVRVYRKIIAGRGRIDAAAYTVERLKEAYGIPAPWIDEAIGGYRNIWDGWLEMLDGYMDMVESYEQRGTVGLERND